MFSLSGPSFRLRRWGCVRCGWGGGGREQTFCEARSLLKVALHGSTRRAMIVTVNQLAVTDVEHHWQYEGERLTCPQHSHIAARERMLRVTTLFSGHKTEAIIPVRFQRSISSFGAFANSQYDCHWTSWTRKLEINFRSRFCRRTSEDSLIYIARRCQQVWWDLQGQNFVLVWLLCAGTQGLWRLSAMIEAL